MTVHLHAQGLFTWPEWAAALTAQIKGAAVDDGSQYYQHWLEALEQMVLRKQVGTAEQLHALEHAWEAAAERTPHGEAIELQPQDFHAAH
jgi:nitrile hydratase accessory protein